MTTPQLRPVKLQRAWCTVASILALFVTVTLSAKEPDSIPELRFETEAGQENLVARLGQLEPERLANAVSLAGLIDAGDPIRVVLADESSSAAQNTPSWVAGYAYGTSGVIVLFPARSPGYPDSSLDELLLHEVAHVLTARASASKRIPRWFDEGLALFIGRPWGLDDRSYMSLAVLTKAEPTLDELEDRFHGSSYEIRLAYAVSGALVRDLVRRHGRSAPGDILAGVALGIPFDDAYRRATGETLAHAQSSFWKRHSFWYRWVPVLTSSVTLWIGITLLALVAIRRRRQRDADLYARWQDEERLREAERLRAFEPPVN